MLFTSPSLLVVSTTLFTAALAAPARTHCRCTIVSNAPSPAIYTPSVAHWTPSDPIASPVVADLCSNLGPELENFQHTQPDLYASYIRHSTPASGTEQQRPLSTTVLLEVAVRKGNHDHQNEPRPTSRPHESILCQSVPDPLSAYQSSFANLWALQIIIAVAILACVAEGVHIGMRWYVALPASHNSGLSFAMTKLLMYCRMDRRMQEAEESKKSSLRLLGAEKRLLAIPASSLHVDAVSSPGAEKKLKAYESARFFVTQSSSGKREFTAYDEDDDEANRPVM